MSENGEGKSEYIWGDSALNVCQQMLLHIQTLASKEDRERNEYLKKLAATIEYGRKIGIDEDFVNPLIDQMKKLSANVIEHQAAPSDTDDVPF